MKNEFKQRLLRGEVQIGLWLALADPYSAELCAGAGLDWLLLDGEHSPVDLRTLLAQLQAVAPYPVHPIIRPPVGDAVLIKQMLDIGAQTLLVPMVETAEQARHLVEATRYPPLGIRGVGAGIARAARWGRVADYAQTANAEICLLLQVENLAGLQNLDAIATTEGVDGVFLGAADLSASMGHLGNPGHPEVRSAIMTAIRRIRALGKAPGILSTDPTEARAFIDAGCLFAAVGVDTLLLQQATAALVHRFKPGDAEIPQPQPY
jgi:4-hydroxy-2-oxoheptanedioate aldolase